MLEANIDNMTVTSRRGSFKSSLNISDYLNSEEVCVDDDEWFMACCDWEAAIREEREERTN
jgi:hypothetical protein